MAQYTLVSMRGRNSSPAASGAWTALAGATRLATGVAAAALTMEAASVDVGCTQSATSPNTPVEHIAVTASATAVARLLAAVATTSAAVDVIMEDDGVARETSAAFMNEGVHP